MHRISISHTVLITLLTLLCNGCSSTPQLIGNPEAPYPPPRPPVVGDILHVPSGTYIEHEQMLDAATDARLVYVGETHDNPASHRLQLDLLRRMCERYPDQVTIAMEMFTPAQQSVLDQWRAGELSEKEFLRQSNWNQVWRMDFAYYRELLQFARERRVPILGINADKKLVTQVGRQEFEQLPPEARATLPTLDRDDPYHQALVEAIFGDHDKGKSRLGGFQRVQLLWDETMAENIARYLTTPAGEKRRLLIIAGGNHIRNGFGIPRRVFRRVPTSYIMVATREIEIGADKQDRMMDVTFPVFPMPAFDYLAFSKYESIEKNEVKLGVLLDDSNGQVRVKGVQPGSNAERAGLKEGDRLLRFAGITLNDSFDLVYEIQQRKPGDRASMEIEREGTISTITLEFRAENAGGIGGKALPK